MIKRIGVLATAAPLLVAAAALAEPAARAPGDVVESWHVALAGSSTQAVLALMAPDVTVFESGESELSRDEYASAHLAADMEFARGTRTEIVERRTVSLSEDAAAVVSLTRSSGTFHGRTIASQGAETMLLRRDAEGWRIAHIHWSTRR